MPHLLSLSTAHTHIPTPGDLVTGSWPPCCPWSPPGRAAATRPRAVGMGGCRAAWLTRAPSLACAYVLPWPLLVVLTLLCIHSSPVELSRWNFLDL